MLKYIFVLLCFANLAFGQNLNQYKYVEVPQRFDFQKENNKFNVNLYTKMLLEKYGFVAYMKDELKPEEAATNYCDKVLSVNIEDQSTLFVQKFTVQLLDCQNNVVYSSKQGTSRTKDLKVASVQALRMAFESFDTLGYKYEEKTSTKIVSAAANHSAEALQLSNSPVSSEVKNSSAEIEFIAKAIDNGFLLQSASLPDIRMQKSNIDNYYIAQIGDLPAMIYRIGKVWKLDFYQNAKLQTKIISIRF